MSKPFYIPIKEDWFMCFESRMGGRVFLTLLAAAGCVSGQAVRLRATGAQTNTNRSTDTNTKPTIPCEFAPLREGCRKQLQDTAGHIPDRVAFINSFYQTYSSISFLGQVKSIYNGSAAAAAISADLASLNFLPGMQLTVTTNAEAGSNGARQASGFSSLSGPTLTAAAAGQATQNILSGGTVLASAIYPLVAMGAANVSKAGAFGLSVDLAVREGADIQNFTAGTSTTASSPPTHTNAGIEGYMYLNSTNNAPNSNVLAGALFVGGSYGFNYMSHDYAHDYGFGNHIHNGVGQISAGILLNNVAKISVSRGFGPSQMYVDSLTFAQTTVNNFKSWSIGITYQSAPPTK